MAVKKSKFQESIENLNLMLRRVTSSSQPGKGPPRVLVTQSGDEYFVYKFEKLFKEHFLTSSLVEVAEIVDGSALKVVELEKLLFERDMFQAQKLIQVRKAEKIKFLPDFLKSRGEELGNCPHHVHFSFLGKEISKKSPLLAFDVLSIEPPYPSEIPAYVISLAKARGLALGSVEAHALSQNYGHDLSLLENEVNTISLLVREHSFEIKKYLSTELSFSKSEPAFKLVDLILETPQQSGSRSGALILLHALLREGTSALSVVGVLARHLRLALKVIEESANSTSGDSQSFEFARRLRIPHFQLKKYNQYCLKMGKVKIRYALSLLANADFKIKSSRCVDEDLLTRCLLAQIQ